MRKGWRTIVLGLLALAFPLTSPGRGAPPLGVADDPVVRLTIEINWTRPILPALPNAPAPAQVPVEIDLELTEGRVIEALGWPPTGTEVPEARLAGRPGGSGKGLGDGSGRGSRRR